MKQQKYKLTHIGLLAQGTRNHTHLQAQASGFLARPQRDGRLLCNMRIAHFLYPYIPCNIAPTHSLIGGMRMTVASKARLRAVLLRGLLPLAVQVGALCVGAQVPAVGPIRIHVWHLHARNRTRVTGADQKQHHVNTEHC